MLLLTLEARNVTNIAKNDIYNWIDVHEFGNGLRQAANKLEDCLRIRSRKFTDFFRELYASSKALYNTLNSFSF